MSELIRRDEAAALLGVSLNKLYRIMEQPGAPERVKRMYENSLTWFYRRDQVIAFAETLPNRPAFSDNLAQQFIRGKF